MSIGPVIVILAVIFLHTLPSVLSLNWAYSGTNVMHERMWRRLVVGIPSFFQILSSIMLLLTIGIGWGLLESHHRAAVVDHIAGPPPMTRPGTRPSPAPATPGPATMSGPTKTKASDPTSMLMHKFLV